MGWNGAKGHGNNVEREREVESSGRRVTASFGYFTSSVSPTSYF